MTMNQVPSGIMWKFKHGTCVAAHTLDDAVQYMNEVSPRDFWASENTENHWDVQLSDRVVVYEVGAESVLDAVKKARWYLHLDRSIKSLE